MCITMCMTSYPHLRSRVLESTRLNFATTTTPAFPALPRTIGAMTDSLEPRDPEDITVLQDAIRQHNTAKIRAVLTALEPQIDGSYGPVNPRLIEVYFKGLAEIAKLYRVYDPPRQRPEEESPERTADQLRAVAEKQLKELAARAAGTSGD